MNLLNKIQQELKAPKGQRNSFGNYNYRSCEDIVEAVKPLLGEGTLTLSDDIVNIGDRYYVKATASLNYREEGREPQEFKVSAFARESLDKKGMDSAQITGAASSYARKYALNGLFAIDDTKDADTMDNGVQPKQTPKKEEAIKRYKEYAKVIPKEAQGTKPQKMGPSWGAKLSQRLEMLEIDPRQLDIAIKGKIPNPIVDFTINDVKRVLESLKDQTTIDKVKKIKIETTVEEDLGEIEVPF